MAAKLNVNPTRMELLRLRRRLAVAVRGHKLLKDKLEGITREFMEVIRLYREKRRMVDEKLPEMLRLFVLAEASSSREVVASSLEGARQDLRIEASTTRLMGVAVPRIAPAFGEPTGLYSLVLTPPGLDNAVDSLKGFLPEILRMAELEETVRIMCREIERTRRRVNALEHTFIPRMSETVKFIVGKLDEMERSNTARLMKVKSMRQKEQTGPDGALDP